MPPLFRRTARRLLVASVTMWMLGASTVASVLVWPPATPSHAVALLGTMALCVSAAAVFTVCTVIARVLPPIATAWFLGHRDGVLGRRREWQGSLRAVK